MTEIKLSLVAALLLAPLFLAAAEPELNREQLLERVSGIMPTPASPVDDKEEQKLLRRELQILERMPVEDVTAHRTAAACFGEIPKAAERICRTVTIDPGQTRWHSTGLYAAPGEKITVKISPETAAKGIFVRISGHTDDISRRVGWKRMPRVSRSFKIDRSEKQIASHFGGLIYVDLGDKPSLDETFKVEFENALASPFFVLGETSDKEWVERISKNPAPYAELVCDRLCIALPSSHVRELENPTELMEFWNKTVAGHDWLADHSHLRKFPDRINIDVQVSVGAAHSGYPTQGASPWGLTDLEHLRREGSWGWFHELGHEAQTRPDKRWTYTNFYTFSDSIECTVNLFSSHARDIHGIKSTAGWGWTSHPEEVMKRALAVVSDPGKSYGSVGVGDKLAMWLQLRDAFGWQVWADVLGGYTRDFDAGRIGGKWGDQRKRDELLLRLSSASGHDLTRFVRDYWRLKIGDDAAAKVAALELPEWLPAMGGISGAVAVPSEGRDFDLAEAAMSFDGKARVVVLEQPENGRLIGRGEGVWRYVPDGDFRGEDRFSYAVESSTGHLAETLVMPLVGKGVARRM